MLVTVFNMFDISVKRNYNIFIINFSTPILKYHEHQIIAIRTKYRQIINVTICFAVYQFRRIVMIVLVIYHRVNLKMPIPGKF